MGGILKIFDFLQRGQALRRGQPSEVDLQDRDLRNSLALRNQSRSELSSALGALDTLDRLKKSDLSYRAELGGMSEDDYIRKSADDREENRRTLITQREAQTKRLTEGPADTQVEIDDLESKALEEHGIHVPPGRVSASVLGILSNLEGREITATAKGKGGTGRKGTFFKLVDDNGRVVGAWNPATGEQPSVPPAAEGLRSTGMSTGELDRRGMLKLIGESAVTLENVASKNKGSIGYYSGKATSVKRSGALDFLGISSTSEENDLFHTAQNLTDLLLRARSGAQINEQEYVRLSGLVPNPEKGEKRFFDDLRRFKQELAVLSSVRDTDIPGITPGVPAAGGSSLADQARAELARRRGRQ